MGVFLEWLETPGGLWQTAQPENRAEELIQSMEDIRAGGDIQINVYNRLVTLAESVGQLAIFSDDLVDQTFQPLTDGYYSWEFLFEWMRQLREQRLEDGRRRTAA